VKPGRERGSPGGVGGGGADVMYLQVLPCTRTRIIKECGANWNRTRV